MAVVSINRYNYDKNNQEIWRFLTKNRKICRIFNRRRLSDVRKSSVTNEMKNFQVSDGHFLEKLQMKVKKIQN
jgi:hypothetical protein